MHHLSTFTQVLGNYMGDFSHTGSTCKDPQEFPLASYTKHSPLLSRNPPGTPGRECCNPSSDEKYQASNDNLDHRAKTTLHPSFPERKQASLCTDCFDVGTRKLILEKQFTYHQQKSNKIQEKGD